jgi:hypothetical protein
MKTLTIFIQGSISSHTDNQLSAFMKRQTSKHGITFWTGCEMIIDLLPRP